jgi:ATP-dependent Clp protease adaptor protein ClpS
MNLEAKIWNQNNPTEKEYFETDTLDEELYQLIVWNDDVNTFDWVIESLVEICHHSPEQAEQCALLIHYKGKCTVKNGEYIDLSTMCEALLDRGISATVDVCAA